MGNEVDPITDLTDSESFKATTTATLDKIYSEDITVSLSTSGSAKVTDDHTLSLKQLLLALVLRVGHHLLLKKTILTKQIETL